MADEKNTPADPLREAMPIQDSEMDAWGWPREQQIAYREGRLVDYMRARAALATKPAEQPATQMIEPTDWEAHADVLNAALTEERRKFQAETRRTSELMQMLMKWVGRQPPAPEPEGKK